MSYLEGLNEAQKQAVLQTEGPLLILAGAGAGKTKTLTHRILHLIKEGTAPSQILAITFTNKAAKEMRERVNSLISNDSSFNKPISNNERPFVSTFHSLGVHIIKEHGRVLGIPRNFVIFDRNDSKKVVKDALKSAHYDPKEYDPGKILNIISRKKGDMVTVDEYESEDVHSYMKEAVVLAWRKYNKALFDEKALDFDDLLYKAAILLRDHKEVREHYQNVWKYIHIDEYQDTNEVQYMMSKILGDVHKNVCVVGDIDQNIYTWRGASIKNILHFEKDYPNACEIVLEENYRSTQTILTVANDIIKKNVMRKDKNLFTNNKEGEKMHLYNAFDENDEARHVADTANSLINKGVKPNEIAVLYRANFQSRVLEEAFLNNGVPYQVLGTRFFDRREIKDVIAYLVSALNPESLTALGRVINTPARGIGKVTFLKVCEGKSNELSGKAREKVDSFYRLLERIREKIYSEKPSEVIKYVFEHTGLDANFKKDGEDGQERSENVKELATLATKYDVLPLGEGIEKLIEDAALASDQDELSKDNGGVKLMTIHASKGLEFDYVFITGLEDGLFPHEKLNEAKEDSEEERRLFYVALTRAREKVYLTYAGIRTIFGSQQVNTPSEFIYDINDEHLESDEKDDVSAAVKSIFIDF